MATPQKKPQHLRDIITEMAVEDLKKERAKTAESILAANRKALLKKAKDGGTLTAAQLALIQAEASGVEGDVETYVENLSDLAAVLEISRVTLNTWRQIPGAPKPDSAGRHSTAAWFAFRDRNCLKGSETSEEMSEKLRGERLKNEDRELDLAIKREEWTANAVLVEQLGQIQAAQKKLLRQKLEREWPAKLPKELQAAAREEGRKLMDEICRQMQAIIDEIGERLPAEVEGE